MRLFLFITATLFCTHSALSQREAENWHLGDNAHLSFQTGTPAAGATPSIVSGGTMAPISFGNGNVSQSDSLGNFLFAAAGGGMINFFPSNLGAFMAGSTGLTNGVEQGIITVRKSGKRYYVIYSSIVNSGIMPSISYVRYAELDMALSAGLGSVTSVQNTLSPQGLYMMEIVTATRHCNKTDHWILAHEMNNNKFHAYLATGSGINPSPVISALGSVAANYALGNPFVGYYNKSFSRFKFSPNGRKVAITMPYRSVELFDFDNATGVLSNSLALDGNYMPGATSNYTDQASHGIEFSPDGTKLFVSYVNHPFICQFDLCAGSATAIAASKTVISNTILSATLRSELQNGPDGKIYVAHPFSDSIGVVNNPNALGLACNYVPNSVSLGTNVTPSLVPVSNEALPYFISNYFEQKPVLPPLSGSITCGNAQFSAPVLPCATTGYSVTGYSWHFDDAISGANNTSTLSNPAHVFSANGTYSVKLTLHYPCGADTLRQVVNITGLPTLSVSGKTSICKGEKTTLTLSGAGTYTVNTLALGQNTTVLQPTVSTTYTLSATSAAGCSAKSLLQLTVLPCLGVEASGDAATSEFRIYPNPAGDNLFVESEAELELIIYNHLGQKLDERKIKPGITQVPLQQHSKGIYFLNARGATYNKTIKIIKE